MRIPTPSQDEVAPPVQLESNGETKHILASSAVVKYQVNATASHKERGSLIDRGANGGILGSDAVILHEHPNRQVDVSGIDSHEIGGLKVVDASAKTTSNRGDIIIIVHQYAYYGRGRSIHSAGQMEHHKAIVYDRSMKVGGYQCIVTLEGYILPLNIINGLPYLPMCPNTKEEWDTLPHVVLTCGDRWFPSCLDHDLSSDENWMNQIKLPKVVSDITNAPFDLRGEYRRREPTTAVLEDVEFPKSEEDDQVRVNFAETTHCRDFIACFKIAAHLNETDIPLVDPDNVDADFPSEQEDEDQLEVVLPIKLRQRKVDYDKFKPYLLHAPREKIRRTFEVTTQNATNVMAGNIITQTTASPFPMHNVRRRNEIVAMDTVFAEVPAIGTGGIKMAQLFVGLSSKVSDAFGMKSEKEVPNTLLDVIRKRGAMDILMSDGAKSHRSERVLDILRNLVIVDHLSEAYYQHQNFAEHRWRHIKKYDRLSINPGTVCVQMAIPGPHSRLWGEGSHL